MFTNKNNKLHKCTTFVCFFFFNDIRCVKIKSSNTPTPKSGNIFRNLHELVDKIN